MHTEDEAKTKWCWRAMGNDSQEKCHGSACMAWRWKGWASTQYTTTKDTMVTDDHGVRFHPTRPGGEGWMESIDYHERDEDGERRRKPPRTPGVTQWMKRSHGQNLVGHQARGYCGLAGRPEAS